MQGLDKNIVLAERKKLLGNMETVDKLFKDRNSQTKKDLKLIRKDVLHQVRNHEQPHNLMGLVAERDMRNERDRYKIERVKMTEVCASDNPYSASAILETNPEAQKHTQE